MKNIVAFLLTLMAVGLLGAQNSPSDNEDYGPQCGTDQMIVRNPFLQQLYAERVACAPEVDLDTAQVLTIPVVFHVIHLGEPVGEGTNISDEQILSCIENLNHRFRADTEALSTLVSAYTNGDPAYDEYELSLAIDSKIEFCLAARDPNNEPTDGIIRHDGSDLSYTNNFSGQTSTAYYAEDGITNGSQYDIPLQGIPDQIIKNWFSWPVDKYFNMYAVSEINGNNGGGGVQGFSYVGSLGTGANGYAYGPVCLYNVTGTVGNLKSGRSINTTWAHEVGHALDLYHTFGVGGDNCDPETNSCTQGDQCPDTPPTSTNTSCTIPDCPDAMLQNYMDYTGEQCKTAFTQNQIERMRDEIYNGLYYLVAESNVSCQSPNAIDLAISSITLPTSWCRDIIDFNVKVINYGGNEVSGAELAFDNNSYALPTLGAGEYVVVPFTDYPLGNGIFNFEVVYDQDEYLDNNVLTHIVEQLEENWVEVAVRPDVWSNEIDWEITDGNGEVVLEDGNWPVFQQDSIFVKSSCLPDGCYTFVITDTNGDGMCAWDFDNDGICDLLGDDSPFINISSNGSLIYELSDPAELNYGSELIVEICVEYSCPLEGDLCPWDLNNDNRVNSSDLIEMLTLINQEVGPCTQGDFNFDGIINQDDLNLLLDNYGVICAEGTIQNKDLTINNEQNERACLVGPPLYFDMLGNQVKYSANLPSGVYIVVEKWSNGDIITKKILLNSWQN